MLQYFSWLLAALCTLHRPSACCGLNVICLPETQVNVLSSVWELGSGVPFKSWFGHKRDQCSSCWISLVSFVLFSLYLGKSAICLSNLLYFHIIEATCLLLNRVLCSPGWPWIHYVAEDDLEFWIPLLLHLEWWNYVWDNDLIPFNDLSVVLF